MSHPLVRWYHLILSAYGFWLPNDPRGSWSDFVASWELYKFGSARTTSEKRSLAHDSHDRSQRLAAKRALKYPPVRFESAQRNAIAEGFAQAACEADYAILACCIGHDHGHLIIARHARTLEQIATHLKSKATMSLNQLGVHPLREFHKPDGSIPTPWAKGIWSVFIDGESHLSSAIRYVEQHAEKEGLPAQTWKFVIRRDV